MREVNKCVDRLGDCGARAHGPRGRFLALVCLLRDEHFEKHGLIDYNFECFKAAITEVFEVRNKLANGRAAAAAAAKP